MGTGILDGARWDSVCLGTQGMADIATLREVPI
jgi:hypothetical protein